MKINVIEAVTTFKGGAWKEVTTAPINLGQEL